MNVLVAGLGKLGATMAAVIADAGHTVLGVDVNRDTVATVNARLSPVDEPGLGELIAALPNGALSATVDYTAAVEATDIAMIVVPTPSRPTGGFDPSFVIDVIYQIGCQIKTSQRTHPYAIVVCSTLTPGTMDNGIIPALEATTGMTVGEGVLAAYSPELIALGTVIDDMTHPDMLLVGSRDSASAMAACQLSATFRPAAPVWSMSFVEAEITKLAINGYLGVKIGFANMIGAVAWEMGADPTVVLGAVGSDNRIGASYLRKGGPPGGPCLGRDLVALEALGTDLAVPMPLVTGARKAARDVIDRVIAEAGVVRKVAVLGVAYKPCSPVTDDSMARTLIQQYTMRGVLVSTYDPHAVIPPEFPFGHRRCGTLDEALADNDVVIIGCPHPEFDGIYFGHRKVINPWAQ